MSDTTAQGSPLNARSLALSALLGTHPPTLSARSLVALAEVFGINGGTMRTALSRMVAGGDVTHADGVYSLAPRLVDRQRAQDTGRRRLPDRNWDGRWHTAVPVVDQRTLADRRNVRTVMANARFGELRSTIWLRPANLPAPELGNDWLVTTGAVSGPDPAELAGLVWDLSELAEIATELDRRIGHVAATLDQDDPSAIPPAFTLSAEVVRFLRSDPLLPTALTPPDWPVDGLRDRYGRFESMLQAMMRPILRGVR